MVAPQPKTLVLLALAIGAIAWLALPDERWRNTIPHAIIALGLAASLALISAANRWLIDARERLSGLSSRRHLLVALAVAFVSGAYLLFTAVRQGRSFYPKYHDEFMILLQARMLAQGRLWMPPHPLRDFFDSFYVFVEPVYASLTWPGAALLYVPSIWFDAPPWVIPLLASAAVAGLLYLVLAELFDGASALLGVLVLLGNHTFRLQSILAQAQIPMMLMTLLGVLASLRWRATQRWQLALALGVIFGWGAITRPIDAICIAVPIGILSLLDLRGKPLHRWMVTAALVSAGAAPLLALQLAFNRGVTGSLTSTPFSFYNQRDQPLLAFGFPEYDPDLPLATRVPQKHIMYRSWVLPAAAEHRPSNTPRRILRQAAFLLEVNLPHPLLVVVLAAGLLCLSRLEPWAIVGAMPMFLLLYAFYTLFLAHYALLVTPAVALLIACGARRVAATWEGRGRTFAYVAVGALCVSALPEFNRGWRDEGRVLPTMDFVGREMAHRVRAPAVVLFQFGPGANYHEEPVYNVDVAWPDDAPIIRAHSLGERNAEIVRYYAERQPDRTFYLFDRTTGELREFGRASDLAAQIPTTTTRSSAN